VALLIDTGCLYALADTSDRNHSRVLDVAQNVQEDLILPAPVLPEVCYLLHSRLGHAALRSFLQHLNDSSICIESMLRADLPRIHRLLTEYADNQLDFVDASIVAMAERLAVHRIMTTDHRHFSVVRAAHCGYFEILP
jgi:predicted nucleic acid-binding protein